MQAAILHLDHPVTAAVLELNSSGRHRHQLELHSPRPASGVGKPLELAPLLKEAGLPDGVINVVTGLGPEVGGPLVEHRDVAKVSFTGSDVTGARIYQAAARTMKRVAMELGGKSPNILLDDADFETVVPAGVRHAMGNAGQSCNAATRMLVPFLAMAAALYWVGVRSKSGGAPTGPVPPAPAGAPSNEPASDAAKPATSCTCRPMP